MCRRSLMLIIVQVLRQSPFDACMQIIGGPKTSLQERYDSFFIGE